MTQKNQRQYVSNELVGIIPAAGTANRLGRLPCSKEIFPVGFRQTRNLDAVQPKVVSQYLLEHMKMCGVKKAIFIIRKGKWDIPGYFGDGKMLNMHIAYLLMDLPYGVPFTIDQAYPFIQDSIVVFGFPDIIFEPEDVYPQLLSVQKQSNADIVLGLFEAMQPPKEDMVAVDQTGRVKTIEIKPSMTGLKYTWLMAVWAPNFTKFLHRLVTKLKKTVAAKELNKSEAKHREWFLGDVIKAALTEKIHVKSVFFPNGSYIDIGTPQNLPQAIRKYVDD